jgi:hypothetical protein
MKSKISVCLISAIGFLIFLIYGSSTIYRMRNQVVTTEETVIGDVKAARGVNLALKFLDQSELGWDVNYSIGNRIQTDSTFKTYYYNDYNINTAPKSYIRTGDFDADELYNQINGDVGEMTILLTDYYEYLPIDLWLSYNSELMPIWGGNNLYKIKIPEGAALRIKKEYNSYYTEPINVPYGVANVPSVMIDEKLYFTITNLKNQIYYEKNSQNNIEYNITSGILAIDGNKGLSYDNIEIVYPLNLENDGTTTVLGLVSVKEDEFLALATLEEQNIYIHLYDIKNNVLVKKEKVGEIPSDRIMNQFDLITQGDFLLANYEYTMEDDTGSRETLQVVGAAYNITESNEIKSVLENEYYTKLVKEMNENYYTAPKDMLFINNKLHLAFNNYFYNNNNTDGNRVNSIVLLTMDKDDILYLGIISNSMIEDYTIGDVNYIHYTMNNERLLIQNRARSIYTVNFTK